MDPSRQAVAATTSSNWPSRSWDGGWDDGWWGWQDWQDWQGSPNLNGEANRNMDECLCPQSLQGLGGTQLMMVGARTGMGRWRSQRSKAKGAFSESHLLEDAFGS